MNNDFCVDTDKYTKKDFLKRIGKLLGTAVLLTGVESIGAVIYFAYGIISGVWNEIGVSNFVVKGVHYLSIIIIFVSLIKLIADGKPFSHTLMICMRIISVIYILSSVVFPRLPGFETNYDILTIGGTPLVDGNTLIIGILVFIFGSIIHEGFNMQKEIDEII